ncbi:MAG: hypothetical protein J0H74_36675, partial [Chitinophagaceae bacterium]|nr:hypothetical protein [Chitinophagaceae bacterium]
MKFVVGAIFALLSACAYAQSVTPTTAYLQFATLSKGSLGELEKKYQHISADLQQRSLHLLDRLRVNDSSVVVLRDKLLYFTDPSAIHPLKEYLPGLDSVQTALKFLSRYKLPVSTLQSLQQLSSRVIILQYRLQQANEVQSFVQSRLQQWQAIPRSFQKQLYYYKMQVQQYKNLLHDPDRLTGKLLSIVRDHPAFREFFSHNSYLSTLFHLPGNSIEIQGQPLPGLQTRSQVGAMVEERLGPGASFASTMSRQVAGGNPLAEGMQQAYDEMNKLKDKVVAWGGGSDANMPDFKPNPYHNKSFFQRIQLGFDLQSQYSNHFIPAVSNLVLSAGYLLNARSIFGAGVGYKLGWGRPFDHIAFSSQGAVLRSFLDWRLKGSLWIAGAYEANYYNA